MSKVSSVPGVRRAYTQRTKRGHFVHFQATGDIDEVIQNVEAETGQTVEKL